jgi:hypothetical protein
MKQVVSIATVKLLNDISFGHMGEWTKPVQQRQSQDPANFFAGLARPQKQKILMFAPLQT